MKINKLKTVLMSTLIIASMSLMAQSYTHGNGNNQGLKNGSGYGHKHEGNFNHGNYTDDNFTPGARMADFLDLSDDQQAKIEALRISHQKEMLPLRNTLNEMHAKMQTLATADKADMKAINALIDDMSVVKTKMAKINAAHRQDVRNILTDEQRIKFDSQPRKKHSKNHKPCGKY